jgi:hypothetical protein
MDTEDARIGSRRGKRRLHFARRIGDQRRQQRGGTELAMRGGDRARPFDCRLIVEQHVAAAIDLKIDKAWRQPDALRHGPKRYRCRKFGARHDADDARTFDHDGRIALRGHAVEHVICGNRVLLRSAHRVRVTFCK